MVSTRFQVRHNNKDDNRGGRSSGNVRDKNICNVAQMPTKQPKLSSGTQQRLRVPTSYRELIRRPPGKRIRVEVTANGHAMNNPTFARRLGQLVSIHVPLLIGDFKNVSQKAKDLIIQDLEQSFNWDSKPDVLAGILNHAWEIHTNRREQLKAIVQSATSLKEAHELVPHGIDLEEWRSTCNWWLTEKFQGRTVGLSDTTQNDSDSSFLGTQKAPEDAFRSPDPPEHCDFVFCSGAGASDGSERGGVSQHDLQELKEEVERIRELDHYRCKDLREQLDWEIQRNNKLAQRNKELIERLQRNNEFMAHVLLFMKHHMGGGPPSFPSHRPDDDSSSSEDD